MILSLLYKLSPDECKFIMIDPKMLELSVYDGIPHLLSPVVTEASKAVVALKWAVNEMEERYRAMSSLGVRNLHGFNEKITKAIKNDEILSRKIQTGFNSETGEPTFEEVEIEKKKLPFIVIIVDEMADLMMVAGKEIEGSVQRLAQMARAAGIHLIMATQRPSVDVVTGVIKANFPTRISFQVTSKIDSRTILGVQGAENLLGQGDMIYMSGGSKLIRVHAPFCSDTEVENVVNYIKSQKSEERVSNQVSFEQMENEQALNHNPADSSNNKDQDLYNSAVEIVRRDKKTSISYVQRQLRIGYNRAASLIEKMQDEGVLTPPNHAGKRDIIE
jgi:S-DNA-T family DNA segregation ATPase FtsK/SpoIIIE